MQTAFKCDLFSVPLGYINFWGVDMSIFSSVIFRIAVLFSFMIIGFILCRTHQLPKEAGTVFSRIENKLLMPAVVINTFRTNCTLRNISEKWNLIAYSAAILAFCIIVAVAVSPLLSKDKYKRRIYRYSLCVSNFGFVGTAMVSGIYGADSIELFDYLMFSMPLNIFTYSIGIAWLVPDKGGFSVKSLFNPIFVSLFIGAAMGIIGFPKNELLSDILSSTAECMSPIAMILTGFIIGGYKFKELLFLPKTYIVAAIRLIAIPAAAVTVLKLINTPSEIIVATLCAHAMPLGLNTVIIPSAYGEDPKTGASMALISQLSSVVTIPFLFYVFGYG